MPKPIGNLTANMKFNDKVSGKTLDRFSSPRTKPPASEASQDNAASKPVKKYKKRKR